MSKNELFEEYFLKYNKLIMKAVMVKSGDYQLAQEISQQVFCAFYTNMDKIDADLVKAWLLRCTRNALVDHLRKRRTRKAAGLTDEYREDGDLPAHTETDYCERRVINADLTGRILKEVRAVNESWYEALMLICVEGMSHREAARSLQVSEQVLRTRMYRARGFVREKFGAEYWGN